MAIISPFTGVRYDPIKVGSLNDVVTPPYDVISLGDHLRYLGKHPNNIIRLILPGEATDNPASSKKYESAAMYLNLWMELNVLARDSEPSIYVCEQEYEIFGQSKRRLGFTCLVKIEDYKQRTVMPHENIMTEPLNDRLQLLRTTGSNFDSVFGLYPDGEIEKLLRPFLMYEPDAVAVDDAGVTCSLWRISHPQTVDSIVSAMSAKSILIADGHHRYAAALAYRDEMRKKERILDPDAPYEYVMMTLVSLEDKGLTILPTHRLVGNVEGFDAKSFKLRLQEFFEMVESPWDRLTNALESTSPDRHAFGIYMGRGESYVITLKSTVDPAQVIDSAGSDALKRLDVSVLHSMILEKLLGIGTESLSLQSNVKYNRDPRECVEAVDRGEYQLAFLMNPTRVDEVRTVAAAGDKMPQKSTFFYPKLITGLVLRVM